MCGRVEQVIQTNTQTENSVTLTSQYLKVTRDPFFSRDYWHDACHKGVKNYYLWVFVLLRKYAPMPSSFKLVRIFKGEICHVICRCPVSVDAKCSQSKQ